MRAPGKTRLEINVGFLTRTAPSGRHFKSCKAEILPAQPSLFQLDFPYKTNMNFFFFFSGTALSKWYAALHFQSRVLQCFIARIIRTLKWLKGRKENNIFIHIKNIF